MSSLPATSPSPPPPTKHQLAAGLTADPAPRTAHTVVAVVPGAMHAEIALSAPPTPRWLMIEEGP